MKTTPSQDRNGGAPARIIAQLEARENALKANELALLLGVTQQHVYKMAAQQDIPSFRVGKAVRFDPSQVAQWLRRRMPQPVSPSSELGIAV
jgi:excisionase family DNA binding protein